MSYVLHVVLKVLVIVLMLQSLGLAASVDSNDDVFLQAQMVHDMALLNYDYIQDVAGHSWVVAVVKPDLQSGHTGIDLDSFVPANGNTGSREVTHPLMDTINGSFQVSKVLTNGGNVHLKSYEWERPAMFTSIGDTFLDHDLAFRRGGTLICRINQGVNGASKFDPVYLIPPEWESFVKPAVTFYRSNAALLRPPPMQGQALPHERQQKVERLLTDKNPFIAVAAWRLLIVSGGLDAATARQELAQSRGMTQALFTYLLLTRLTAAEHAPYTQALLDMVNAAHTSSQLLGISIGVFASVQSETASVSEALAPLLQALDRKQKALATDTAADRQLIDILVECGVRQPEGQAH